MVYNLIYYTIYRGIVKDIIMEVHKMGINSLF